MADNDDSFDPKLWTPRSPEETRAIYQDWAGSYDDDVTGAGYATPTRVAEALAASGVDKTTPTLDFGCGTGLSGAALAAQGFSTIDGTDITAEMIEVARAKGIYRTIWVSEAGDAMPTGYGAIIATGVVSLGAASADTLATLIAALPAGGYLAFSYNDATLASGDYMDALEAAKAHADLISEAYGPHLPGKEMGSTVYVLRKH